MVTENGNVIEPMFDHINYTLELSEDDVRELLRSIAEMTHGFDMMLDTLKWCIQSVDHQIYHELNLIQAMRNSKESRCSTSTDMTSFQALTGSEAQLRLPDTPRS